MSPELLDPERFGLDVSRPTKESDLYALGMVVYEVLSGQAPFVLSTVPVVIRMVLDGELPGRPQGEEGGLFTDAIWGVLEHCWKPQRRDRPSVEAVLLALEGDLYSLRPRSPPAGRDVETDNDDQSDAPASKSSRFSPIHLGPVFNYHGVI
jgi:serine/threonine protein kinase